MKKLLSDNISSLSRRSLLASAAVSGIALASPCARVSAIQATKDSVPADFKVTNKLIRQSVMGWCFNPMPVPELIDHCVKIGA